MQDGVDSVNIIMDCPDNSSTFPSDFQNFNSDPMEQELAFVLEELVDGQVFHASDPLTDAQADASPEREHWAAARQEELSSHVLHNTYGDLVLLPPGQSYTNTGFIYKTKTSGDEAVERYKVRLVFKNHKFSGPKKTWDQVFSPVVDKSTLRIFLAFAAQHKYFICQIDVVTAFLNAALPELCFIKLPKVCGDPEGYVRPLYKALYGHIEAPKLWNKEWSILMLELGFVQSKRDPCLWVHPDESIFIVLYVDDSLIAAKTLCLINKLISSLKSRFNIRELGIPTQFLGMTVRYFQDHGVLLLSQDKYIMKLQCSAFP